MDRTRSNTSCKADATSRASCSCARELSRQLGRAVDLAAVAAGPGFELTGATRLDGCGRRFVWRGRVSLRIEPEVVVSIRKDHAALRVWQ
ncbi:hypothetical protein P1J78_21690 [Psychromarinibacter sp. C21-152]|uniref:Uncharacterized protein n=1 Tax=Psychromarinibacter sediminicola TaxID=3033385 RepID=A0AAE3TA57_9RHOB|nr:hypothetical protein [Psychromarinibacter sediminicola]MDF0603350.1 hypothetical protein [Psychromarinibacter sediminicola]